MIVYQVVGCDGYDVQYLDLCLTREIAERIVAKYDADKRKGYDEWVGSEDYHEALADMTSGADGSFEQWDSDNYNYSIHEHEVVCE